MKIKKLDELQYIKRGNILAVSILYEFEGFVVPWLMPFGLLVTVTVMAFLANTICKAENQ